MLNRFIKFLKDHDLARPGDNLLLAVSGGIDSMAMARLFRLAGFAAAIAHCNFALRGEESDLDEKLVQEYASENGLQFFSERFRTGEYAEKKGISIQMAARELRYDWFRKIRKDHGYDRIAVAHNLNDNVETFIINLVRGTGIAGLTGMKPLAGDIIRPLLFATREEIAEWSAANGVVYREDRSNSEVKYLRNKIRHRIMPILKELNPSVDEAIENTAMRLEGISRIAGLYTGMLRESILTEKDGRVHASVSLLLPHLSNPTLIYELFSPYGVTGKSLVDLIHLAEGRTGGWMVTGTHRILRNREELIITPELHGAGEPILISNIAELGLVPGIGSVRSLEITDSFSIPAEPHSLCIDPDTIVFPLIARRWNRGDFFFPLGMKHRKKLSDYFTDRKYSMLEKEHAMILESDGKIVCIIGDRIDNRFRITGDSRKALIIESGEGKTG